MIKRILFFLLVTLPFLFSNISATENNCVACHSQIKEINVSHPAHSFSEWQNSIHAKKGISCDACHGGDPAAKEINSAHKGLSRSNDAGSLIYFNKIPETCGKCHVKELEGFKQSIHYKELTHSGKGPNCVTCHESMATKVISAKEMDTICTICHRRPTEAYAGLITLKTARNLLDELKKEINSIKNSPIEISGQTLALEQGEKSYQETLQIWHTFDIKKVIEQGRKINQQTRDALNELQLKQKIKND